MSTENTHKRTLINVQPFALLSVVFLLVVAALYLSFPPFVQALFSFLDKTPPILTVWYGTKQTFGRPALSQKWVNILGHVDDPESGITYLRYRLNDGPQTEARLGPDKRRLEHAGDFNIEIDPAQLRAGENILTLEAGNKARLKTTVQVIIDYYPPSPVALSFPYTIDWATTQDFQDVLQVVDGKWEWDARGIHPVELGYDRMLTVGDLRWENFVVTVPLTVEAVDPEAFQNKSGGLHAAIFVDLRWNGHSDIPVECPPPHCGWAPIGSLNKYWFYKDGNDKLGLKIRSRDEDFPALPLKFHVGDTYIFKVSVQTTPEGHHYTMKVWEPASSPEPQEWTFTRTVSPEEGEGGLPNATHGAIALVAHYTDITFGNITIEALP